MDYLFKRFESPEEYADYIEGNGETYATQTYDDDWAGCSRDKAIATLRNGDTKMLERAQAILDKVDLSHLQSVGMPILAPCVAGFVPNVPAAIIGHPEAMFKRTMVDNPSVSAPLTVYVDTTVSAGVSVNSLISRGVAILAFILAAETIRPVDLYCVSLGSSPSNMRQAVGAVCKVQSRPMDLARAVWMLTDPGYSRRCRTEAQYAQHGKRNDPGNWLFNIAPTSPQYESTVREVIGCEPTDVFMKGGYLFDQLMLSDPVAWVQKMLDQHCKEELTT
jgi:hypothetical protein